MLQLPLLSATILLPFAAGLFFPFFPRKKEKYFRWFSIVIGLLTFISFSFLCSSSYNYSLGTLQLQEKFNWIPFLSLDWDVGIDGFSFPLLFLTCFITTLALIGAWPVRRKTRLFYFFLLTLYTAQLGVFAAQNSLFFFFMWEFELVPIYLLVAVFGGKNRLYASNKFILYTAVSSLFILFGILGMAFFGTSSLPGVSGPAFSFYELAYKQYSLNLELCLYICFLLGFLVKIPSIPLHTWLPDTHGQAPTVVSMLLAGIVLKMGAYALIRINMQLFPVAHILFSPLLALSGCVNLVYASLSCFAQQDLKRKIAFSSISHMGFILIGLAALNDLGLKGAMFQMISHGLIGAGLFFLVGALYDRTQTLLVKDLGGLSVKMPKTFAFFMAFCFASFALPGLSGFVAELMVFFGFSMSSFYPLLIRVYVTLFEAVCIILTPIYLISMLRQVFTGPKSIIPQIDQTETKLDFVAFSSAPQSSTNNLVLNSLEYTATESIQPKLNLTKQKIKTLFSDNANLEIKQFLRDKKQVTEVSKKRNLIDLSPRELFICTSLFVPVILFGCYPKTFTVFYEERITSFINQVEKIKKESLIKTPVFDNLNYDKNINFTEYFFK
uniref:Subunit 4 of NADH-plastoquinone oxidoreductase n=1 Tax=Prasinococcus sp. CCMP1194 TaxID=110672 RepID=A0A088CJQ1_9VIRI|nr:subunit 4 of NADH-plastoquinone oxidoreductase [Prasinococcus sp. CCMP1194]